MAWVGAGHDNVLELHRAGGVLSLHELYLPCFDSSPLALLDFAVRLRLRGVGGVCDGA